MKIDKQDEVIDKLYQQRKSSIIAPNVDLEAGKDFNHTQPKRFSIIKCLVVLLGGGLASFGILAVISHLAKAPLVSIQVEPTFINSNVVEYEEGDLSELTAQAIETEIAKVTQQFPVLPKALRRDPVILKAQRVEGSKVEFYIEGKAFLLTSKQPTLAIELTHKVMPEYPRKALINEKTGAVTLSYQVLTSGVVDNIKVINSSDYRLFDKSAVDALSQWEYLSNEHNNTTYQITFEFMKP